MKLLLFVALLVTLTLAKPNGYFHEAHQSYSQSASYQNNELQHKTEDESYYSKHGDLEGRIKPKVDAHSQHSEYVNPKLKTGSLYDSGIGGHQSNTLGSSNYGYGSGYQTYGSQQSSSIQNAQHVQSELQRELQRALANYQRHNQNLGINEYGQVQDNLKDLETELRRNITSKFQEFKTYQSHQSHQDQAQPAYHTYNNQEIDDLTQQTQDNLLRQLAEGTRTQFQYASSSNQVQGSRVIPLRVNVQPVYIPQSSHVEPVRPETVYRPERIQSQPSYTIQVQEPNQPSMESILATATDVQNNLNDQLNLVLSNIEETYLQPNTQTSRPFLENLLVQLQEQLRHNVTVQLQNEFRRVYGYNQKISNFDDLKRQIENNLIKKLNREFNKQMEYYFSNQRQNSYTHQTVYEIKPSYTNYNTDLNLSEIKRRLQEQLQQQVQSAIIEQQRTNIYSGNYQTALEDLKNELNQNLTQQLNQIRSQYRNVDNADLNILKNQLQDDLQKKLQQGLQRSWSSYSSWSSQSSYSYQPSSNNNIDINEVKKQLQQQMQRQVQTAINEQRNNAYSNNYQTTLQHLTNELNQNLTQQLENLKSQYEGNNAQFDNIQRQLQDDLKNQLQQGLQRSWSSYSSWSGSASYGIKGGSANSGAALNQIKRQLENQLQNQLQSALSQQHSSYGNGYQQATLQELTDELNQNLTRQLQQLRSQSQYYGQGYDDEFENLQNQLQGDLQRQLQQRYSSYSSSSSYSARSSSSSGTSAGAEAGNYRATRGYGVCCQDQHSIYKRSVEETNENISDLIFQTIQNTLRKVKE